MRRPLLAIPLAVLLFAGIIVGIALRRQTAHGVLPVLHWQSLVR